MAVDLEEDPDDRGGETWEQLLERLESGMEGVACPHCRSLNPPEGIYCGSCGGWLRLWACQKCSRPNEDGGGYCVYCGTRLPRVFRDSAVESPEAFLFTSRAQVMCPSEALLALVSLLAVFLGAAGLLTMVGFPGFSGLPGLPWLTGFRGRLWVTGVLGAAGLLVLVRIAWIVNVFRGASVMVTGRAVVLSGWPGFSEHARWTHRELVGVDAGRWSSTVYILDSHGATHSVKRVARRDELVSVIGTFVGWSSPPGSVDGWWRKRCQSAGGGGDAVLR